MASYQYVYHMDGVLRHVGRLGSVGRADDARLAERRPVGRRLEHGVPRDLQAGIDAEDAGSVRCMR